MPIKVVGNERWLSWQPKGQSKRNQLGAPRQPTVGLGPVGMIGSVGYNENNLSPQAKKWEQMGLYWTGHGVARGEPIAKIDQDIAASKLQGKQNQQSIDANIRQGDSRIRQDDERIGIARYDSGVRAKESEANIGIALDKLNQDWDIASRRDRIDMLGLAADLDPDSQAAAFQYAEDARTPTAPLARAAKIDPLPKYEDDPLIQGVARAMRIDPDSRYAPGQYKAIAEELKLPGGVGQLKTEIERLGPAINADLQRRGLPGVGIVDSSVAPEGGPSRGRTKAKAKTAASSPGADGIPPGEIERVKQQLRAEGKPVPPDNVIRNALLQRAAQGRQ